MYLYQSEMKRKSSNWKNAEYHIQNMNKLLCQFILLLYNYFSLYRVSFVHMQMTKLLHIIIMMLKERIDIEKDQNENHHLFMQRNENHLFQTYFLLFT